MLRCRRCHAVAENFLFAIWYGAPACHAVANFGWLLKGVGRMLEAHRSTLIHATLLTLDSNCAMTHTATRIQHITTLQT